MLRLPKTLTDILADAREWHVEAGKKHYKLVVNGRLAGVLTKGTGRQNYRDVLNTKTQIRRILSLTA